MSGTVLDPAPNVGSWPAPYNSANSNSPHTYNVNYTSLNVSEGWNASRYARITTEASVRKYPASLTIDFPFPETFPGYLARAHTRVSDISIVVFIGRDK